MFRRLISSEVHLSLITSTVKSGEYSGLALNYSVCLDAHLNLRSRMFITQPCVYWRACWENRSDGTGKCPIVLNLQMDGPARKSGVFKGK